MPFPEIRSTYLIDVSLAYFLTVGTCIAIIVAGLLSIDK
jgi:hypothetical protein